MTGAAVGAGAVAVGAMWLPWFRSGSAGRSSFDIFRAAQILGVEWATPFRVFWFLLPVVFLAAVVAWLFDGVGAATASLIFLGLVLTGAGVLALALFGFQSGSLTTTAGGACTMVLATTGLRGRGGPQPGEQG